MNRSAAGPGNTSSLGLLFFLVFSSGVTGLTYQVIWVRMLSDALGVTVLAVVSVLAVFMGGLALGRIDEARAEAEAAAREAPANERFQDLLERTR